MFLKMNVFKFDSIYEGECCISDFIKNDNNCSAHFEYDSNSLLDKMKLNLVTYNPKHKSFFNLHTIHAKTKVECLENMYNHIYNLKKTLAQKNSPYLNYTIEWYNPKNSKVETSSFYGETIQEVIKKFYYGKTQDTTTTIYSIKLNPTPCC